MSKTWLGYPEPANTDPIPRVSVQHVAAMIRNNPSGQDFQLIDVRRSDLTGSMIKTSINLPAHTFLPNCNSIASLLKQKKTLIFYCNSSNGRGPRCAGWIREAYGTRQRPDIVIMEGGAKAFIAEYGDDAELVIKLPAEVTDS